MKPTNPHRIRALELAAKFRRWGMYGDARGHVLACMSTMAATRYRARHGITNGSAPRHPDMRP